jgi:hypothetical protein
VSVQTIATKIFHFDQCISSGEAVAAIRAYDHDNPWEPAKIEDLLEFAISNAGSKRERPIVGLGYIAEVKGSRFAAALAEHDEGTAKQPLALFWWQDGGYYACCDFLAVRKQSSAT